MKNLRTYICRYEAILMDSSGYSCEELASIEEKLFTARHIVSLWEEFKNIPMHPSLEITEKNWHHFPAGTHKETIYRWFEDCFKISVAENLMYCE